MPLWLKEKLWMRDTICDQLGFDGTVIFPEHHESHAASAFFPSPFDEAAILTVDGVGEWASTSVGVGSGNKIDLLYEIDFPHSLGLLYSAITYYTGFKVNSGEYKVMGLAPYGEPKYVDTILNNLIDLKEDGSYKLDMSYFDYGAGLRMTNEKFDRLFGGPPRKAETDISQKEMDMARSIQEVIEIAVLRIGRFIRKETGQKNLCMAGGVALNCVANGKLYKEKIFDNIWVQPAAGDAGGALGCALMAWYQVEGNERKADGKKDFQRGSYLGPDYTVDEVKTFVESNGYNAVYLDDEAMATAVAEILADEKVVGWFNGPMEFGPRALGGRSIIGDARSPKMQSTMNLKIKFRESFRPFAPSLLLERTADWFDCDYESPYMLMVAPVKEERRIAMSEAEKNLFGIEKLNVPRSDIPAVTHVDYSARLQTVDGEANPLYYNVIKKFEEKTGCPIIINTSFNVRGEPIVCRPMEAYTCFMRTHMDFLVIGSYLFDKTKQPEFADTGDWQNEFELD